ncbi:DUF3822 family protein [Aurantibacillus circumpalustris]|uniref:DUF3822 family protein n=1 Tax=Aurantibacillus circumpalustris TaxID=3036359 RepID=UPI00295B5FB1|nr:DUF3822 family protein [Aurantibacillus circumpalustris]
MTKYYHSEKAVKNEPLCLSMFISVNSFEYAISTNNFKNVLELCHVEITHLANSSFDLTERISFLINNYLLHQKKFEKVNVCFLNNNFTLIPEAFNVGADIKPLLKFATGAEQLKRSLQHNLKNINFSYAIEIDLISYFEKKFPNISIRHAGAVSSALFFSQHSLVNQNLFLNIGDGHIEIAAKDQNELLFYNVFNVENNEDILYYLLFTMEQLQLSPLHVKLSIASQKETSDELIKNIKKYIKQVDFCVNDTSINLNGDLSTLPKHFYFTLLNQHLCEL